MKRRLFFLFDKLKISRNERMAVSVLMVILISLLFSNTLISSDSPFDEKYYQELDNQFKKRTAVLKQKKQAILARYRGISPSKMALKPSLTDTIPGLASPDAVNVININEAGLEKLQKLPGVGPVHARRIIKYRNENGLFKTSRELLNVKGIGHATLMKMMPYIYIEHHSEKPDSDVVTDSKVISSDESSPNENISNILSIDVNTANRQELQKLPGIGPAYSQRIIDYRHEHGGFETFEELLAIKGIGPATLSKIKPFISLGKGAAKLDSVNAKHQSQNKKAYNKQTVTDYMLIDINTADAQKLQTLPGIGPVYSHRIITYRHKNGPFKTKNTLLKIKGIGKKTLAKIKPFIKLKE